MPSEKSIYIKIQKVLDVAKSVKVSTRKDLADKIMDQGLPNFITLQYNREEDTFKPKTSKRVIRSILALCKTLGLIEEDGNLTDEGRKALLRTQYDQVIVSRIRSHLRRSSVNFKELNKIILENLKSNPPILPTTKEIWSAIDSEISYSLFSRILTLLAQCGGAKSSQKKIYLHIKED